MTTPSHRFFLGGRDLEMVAIRELLVECGLGEAVVDAGLAWGARASACEAPIREALARGETPVLVELADDLPGDLDRARLVLVDHHGARAGADRPTSLEQVFALIGAPRDLWTRRRALVAANDRGHVPAMRALGATAEEIRAVRDADRAAQGVTPEIEAESRRALAAARRSGALLVVTTAAPTASAVVDFLLPEYGGPEGETDLLVTTAGAHGFYGDGRVIAALAGVPGAWWGGALPARGYWGAPRTAISAPELETRIAALLPA